MKRPTALAAAMLVFCAWATPAALAGGVTTVRGPTAVPDGAAAPPLAEQQISDARIPRTFGAQPPLIPHDVEDLEVGIAENACLQCHDRPNAADAGAPAAADSHYRGRAGEARETLSRDRWFCQQCHVPQTRTRPLVANEFQGGQ